MPEIFDRLWVDASRIWDDNFGMDTNDLSFVKKALDSMRPVEWAVVAEKSGVPLGTLRKVAYGEVTDPRFWTVNKLATYFRTPPK